jgi:hypothetical protein
MEDFLLELKALTHPAALERRLEEAWLFLEQLEQLTLDFIREARAGGASWEEISRSLRDQDS